MANRITDKRQAAYAQFMAALSLRAPGSVRYHLREILGLAPRRQKIVFTAAPDEATEHVTITRRDVQAALVCNRDLFTEDQWDRVMIKVLPLHDTTNAIKTQPGV